MHRSRKGTTILPSHFVPGILRIPTTELLKSPHKYARIIGLALLGDVMVASALPLGVLILLLAAGIQNTVLAPLSGAVGFVVFAQKLGHLDRQSRVHCTLLCGGTIYIFNSREGIRAAASLTDAINAPESKPHERLRRRVYAVRVPGLLAPRAIPTMREVRPEQRRVEIPVDLDAI